MLTSIVQAKITPQGIETPLGILTVEQIERGGGILSELEAILEVLLFQVSVENICEELIRIV